MAVAGFPSTSLRFHCCGEGAVARISASGWPEGTRFTVGDETWVQERIGTTHTKVPLRRFFGGLSLAGYHDVKAHPEPPGVTVPIRIELRGPWQPIVTEAPTASIKHHIAPLTLEGIVDGPIAFVHEPTKERPDTALVVKDHTMRLGPLFGPGRRLEDVDWVVVPFWKDTGKVKACGGYSRVQGVGGNTKVSFALHEVEVAIYDRRTGTVLGAKTFPPMSACPTYTAGDRPAIGADNKAMTAWVKAQLAGGKVI
jgi:hypothetical protein